MPYPDRNAYPDRFYPVVDSVAWVARLALLDVGTIQLRAKDLNDSEALQLVSDALAVIKGTPAKLVVNDYWRAAIVAGAKHLHLGQEDLVDADLKAIRDAGLTLGLSTHDDAELETALRAEPDYIALVVDAGLGAPSHAAQALELGYDAVLLNTAIAKAADPVAMANAFRLGVEAGRTAYEAGLMEARDFASPSTPVIGTPFWHAVS